MQSNTNVKNTILQAIDGNCYEVVNSTDEIECIMYDDFIKPNTFIQLIFPDGCKLHIRKGSIIAFYESD